MALEFGQYMVKYSKPILSSECQSFGRSEGNVFFLKCIHILNADNEQKQLLCV